MEIINILAWQKLITKRCVHLVLISILYVFTIQAYAEEFSTSCAEALESQPISEYVNAGQQHVAKSLAEEPHPSFVDANEDRAIPRSGLDLPETLTAFVGNTEGLRIQALKTPSFNSEHPSVVTRFVPHTGVSAHLEMDINGKTESTQVYFNMPLATNVDQLKGSFLFSGKKGHKLIFYHGHGGGTPMAESMNASSIAEYTVRFGIPLMAVDQAGHGKNTDGDMLSFDNKIEYNLSVLEKVVDKDVKVILSGHSWGGEDLFYFWSNYYPRNKNGRFKQILSQIVGVVPLSPPADLTLGKGDFRERLEMEEKVFQAMQDSQDYDSNVAEKDLEFIKNVLRSGKSSVRALWKTLLTQIYFSTPLPQPEQLKDLPLIKVYMGKWDGLVYVGREYAFEPWQKLLGENFVLMDTYDTQREKNVKQGHQTFDAINKDGSPVVYSGMLDLARQATGYDFPLVNYDGSHLNIYIVLLNKILIRYLNFFPAREYFKSREVIVSEELPLGIENNKLISKLEGYLKGIQNIRIKEQKQFNALMEQSIGQLAKKYQVKGGLDGAHKELDFEPSSPERTIELNNFIDKALKLEKLFYQTRKFSYDKDSQDQINEIIKTAQDEYVKIYETTHAKLQEGESLPGIEMLGEIAHRIVELEEGKNGLKNLYSNRNKNQKYSQAVRDIFTESRIDSVIKNSPTNPYKEQLLELMANPEADISQFINEEVQAYIIAEIDNKIKDKRSFEVSKRLKDLKDERHKKLDFIIQKIKEVKKAYSVESQNLWAKKAEAIDPDLGVSSIKDARWELSAAELTPEQRVQRSLQLQEFLAAVEVERRKIRNIVQAEMTENINNFNKNKMPQGFSSEIEVRHKLAYLKALKEKTYVPSVDSEYTQTLQMIVDEIHDVDKTMSELKFEKEKLSEEFNLKQLIKQRNDILKHLNKLFEDSHIADGSDKWPNREMPLWWSLDIKKKVERREKALMQWKEIEKDLTHLIQEYLVAKLETQGGFVPEDFKNIPENIQQGIVKYNEYRENFFNAKQEVLSAFLNSLRKGELPNPGAESIEEVPDFNNSQASINELLGQSDISVTPPIFDDNSLESKIREAETKWLILLQKESHLNARKDLLSYQYNQYLAKIAPDLITTHFTLVDVGQILTMGMDRVNELMSQPNSEIYEKALKQTIDDWDEKWKDIVNENQLANPDWYPLNPFLYRTARGKSH